MAQFIPSLKPFGPAILLLSVAMILVINTRAGSTTIFDDDWKPPVSVPTTPPPVNTPSQPPPPAPRTTSPASGLSRMPMPSLAAQTTSRKLFREVFAKELPDHSIAGRRAFGQSLMDEARKSASVPSDRFVLLVGAADAGREASDLALSFRAIEGLAEAFDIDALVFKLGYALRTPLISDSPAITMQNGRLALALVNDMVAANDVATADRLLTLLRDPARADPSLGVEVQARRRDVEILRAGLNQLASDSAKLKKSPDDAAANLSVGRFLCLMKGNWRDGLPMLAKGSDDKFRQLAEDELSERPDADALTRAADGWWDVAETLSEPSRSSVLQHAAALYLRAGDGASGLRRELRAKRIAQATELRPMAGRIFSEQQGNGPIQQAAVAPPTVVPPKPVPAGGAVDLIALVEPQRDTLRGIWTKRGGELSEESSNPSGALIAFPIHPGGDYEIDVRATRKRGADFNIIFPIVDHATRLVLGAASERGWVTVNHGRNAGSLSGSDYHVGQAVDITIVVKFVTGNSAAVTVKLDGSEFISVTAPFEQLWEHSLEDWGVEDTSLIHLRTNAKMTVQAATLRMLTGITIPPGAPALGPVTILRADYGNSERTFSLTQAIQKALDADPFTPIDIGNSWAGDPSPNNGKSLTLSYRIGDTTRITERSENQIIFLPPIPKSGLAIPGASIPFKIVAARYGADNRWVDVTAAIQAELVDPSQPIVVRNMAGKDLLWGKVKRLVVYYEIQGRRYVHVTDEKSMMTLIPKM
jgi:hypothetical protein